MTVNQSHKETQPRYLTGALGEPVGLSSADRIQVSVMLLIEVTAIVALTGVLVRSRWAQLAALRDRAAALERERVSAEARAAAEERLRVSAELLKLRSTRSAWIPLAAAVVAVVANTSIAGHDGQHAPVTGRAARPAARLGRATRRRRGAARLDRAVGWGTSGTAPRSPPSSASRNGCASYPPNSPPPR